MRDTTNAEKLADLVKAQTAASESTAAESELVESLRQLAPNDRDFVHPYYWAAFIHVGV